MSSLVESINQGDIFVANVTHKRSSTGNGSLLESTNKIVCWGANGKLPVRCVGKTPGGDRLATVPADETSIESGNKYTEQTVECCRVDCTNSVYLPEKYASNPIFCSFDCLKQCRCGSAGIDTEQNMVRTRTKSSPDTEASTQGIEFGQRRTATVSHFSSNDNALIQHPNGSYNVGPLRFEAKHEKLEFMFFRESSNFALCLNKEYWSENYLEEMERMMQGQQIPSKQDLPEPTNSTGSTDHAVTDTDQTEYEGIAGQNQTDTTSEDGKFTNSSKNEKQENEYPQENESETTDSTLESLRKKAEEDAEENVETTSRSLATKEYTRSNSVRNYVLARADGYCEGCGEPAPFVSKTGDPYLHAHHIHELSGGGSDTPDTVMALCPNCHYRVHHGNDGDEYNQKLKRKLEEIEDDSTEK